MTQCRGAGSGQARQSRRYHSHVERRVAISACSLPLAAAWAGSAGHGLGRRRSASSNNGCRGTDLVVTPPRLHSRRRKPPRPPGRGCPDCQPCRARPPQEPAQRVVSGHQLRDSERVASQSDAEALHCCSVGSNSRETRRCHQRRLAIAWVDREAAEEQRRGLVLIACAAQAHACFVAGEVVSLGEPALLQGPHLGQVTDHLAVRSVGATQNRKGSVKREASFRVLPLLRPDPGKVDKLRARIETAKARVLVGAETGARTMAARRRNKSKRQACQSGRVLMAPSLPLRARRQERERLTRSATATCESPNSVAHSSPHCSKSRAAVSSCWNATATQPRSLSAFASSLFPSTWRGPFPMSLDMVNAARTMTVAAASSSPAGAPASGSLLRRASRALEVVAEAVEADSARATPAAM